MRALEEALRSAFARAADEAYRTVTSFGDGDFPVLSSGPWRTRMYTGERSGRCVFLFWEFPWRAERQGSFYYSGPGCEGKLRAHLDHLVDECPVFMSNYVMDSLVGLVSGLGQEAVQSALSEAVMTSVMGG